MSADGVYLAAGAALMIAVALPHAVRRVPISVPIVLVLLAFAVGFLPMPGGVVVSPVQYRGLTERLSELCVIVSLMGVGLALDRPLSLRRWSTFRTWRTTWRLLALGMPLCIAGTALLGSWVMGLAPAAALLLGATLAPTDPVLAAEIQVEGPTTDELGHVDEDDEVRFALTSEAGLNDALAFPFVYAAIFLSQGRDLGQWWVGWLAWELIGKSAIGLVVGVLAGRGLGWLAFRSRSTALRFADRGEPLLAFGATLLAYGAAEMLGGWGFLAVFCAALALRASERDHDYHGEMHALIERLEVLLTLILLVLLGISLGDGLLSSLTWQGAVLGIVVLLGVRPLTAWLALGRHTDTEGATRYRLGPRERLVTAFFGVRGIGSVYYLAYAMGVGVFPQEALLWSTVAFTIVASVVIHGVAASPALTWLEATRQADADRGD